MNTNTTKEQVKMIIVALREAAEEAIQSVYRAEADPTIKKSELKKIVKKGLADFHKYANLAARLEIDERHCGH